MKKVTIHIDGSNFYSAVRDLYGRTNIDYRALMNKLTNIKPGRELLRGYFYTVELPEDYDPVEREKNARFIYTISQVPYLDIVYGKLRRRVTPTGHTYYEEKGTDINLAVNLLTGAFLGTYDVAVVVAGDTDYSKVISEVKRLGKHVEIAWFRNQSPYNLSQELVRVADDVIVLDEVFLSDCWYQR
ncbi:MAG: NYN domain-containing protein [Thermoanaerobacterales bacterium]|nr:NYN domain-containing protein [Bacillota bacterium]MDI6907568.1 NYN domain-containing protein [Thermoanaerobacterales bacterium]